jgi:hypothetical protein
LRKALAQFHTPASSNFVHTWLLSDFHLFPTLREFLGGKRFKSDEEVKGAIKAWLNGLTAEGYDVGCADCLDVGGN